MQILVHSHNVDESGQKLNRWIQSEVESGLSSFASRITRIEVYVSDMNSDKKGIDKRCTIEAKCDGMSSIATSCDGDNVAQALNGATDKMQKALDRKLKKLNHHKGNNAMGGRPFADMGGSSQELDDSDYYQEEATL